MGLDLWICFSYRGTYVGVNMTDIDCEVKRCKWNEGGPCSWDDITIQDDPNGGMPICWSFDEDPDWVKHHD